MTKTKDFSSHHDLQREETAHLWDPCHASVSYSRWLTNQAQGDQSHDQQTRASLHCACCTDSAAITCLRWLMRWLTTCSWGTGAAPRRPDCRASEQDQRCSPCHRLPLHQRPWSYLCNNTNTHGNSNNGKINNNNNNNGDNNAFWLVMSQVRARQDAYLCSSWQRHRWGWCPSFVFPTPCCWSGTPPTGTDTPIHKAT